MFSAKSVGKFVFFAALLALLAGLVAPVLAQEPVRAEWGTWPKQKGWVTLWSPEQAVGSATFVVWAWNADAGFSRLGEYTDWVTSGPTGESTTVRWSHPDACGVTGTVRLTRYPGWGSGFGFGCVVATPAPPVPTSTPRPPTATPRPGEPTATPMPPTATPVPGQPTATPVPYPGEPRASTNVPLVLRYLLCDRDGCRRVTNTEVSYQVTSAIVSPDGWEVWLKSVEDFSMDLNPAGEVPVLFDPIRMGRISVRWDGSWYWDTLACMIQPAASSAWPLQFWPGEKQFLLPEDLLAKHGWQGRHALCQLVTIDSLAPITRVVEFRSRPATR